MKRSLFVAALLALTLGLAAFAGTAAAGNGNGNGGGNGNGNGNGNGSGAAPAAQPGAPGNSGNAQGQSKHSADHAQQSAPAQQQQQQQQQPAPSQPASGSDHASHADRSSSSTTSSTQPGVKPSSTTKHWTHTTVGAKPDVSKRYGNGKTAAQIAASRGAPPNQPLTGPGNSQPHKTYDCRHKNNRSGGVDVHAIKSYSAAACESQPQQQESQKPKPEEHPTTTTTTTPTPPVEQHVTICHATGSPDTAGNGYVMISPSASGVYHGHLREHAADIIPPFTYE